MKKNIVLSMSGCMIVLIVLVMFILLSKDSEVVLTEIQNPSFESGDLTGWKATGEAFSSAIVSNQTKYEQDGVMRDFFQEGDYHVSSEVNSGKIGSLQSSSFELAGIGIISFLMSGGKDNEGLYVGIYDAKTDELLKKIVNEQFDGQDWTNAYSRIILDCFNYLGRELYIKIVDEASQGDFDYINVDDFIVNVKDEEELRELKADQLLRLGQPVAIDGSILDSSQRYIDLYSYKLDPLNRMGYHVMGEIGWINDPNGFVFYNGQNHLFYQHHPQSTEWGPMHWGHVVSNDLIKWDYAPLALAPKTFKGDGAAFSGSAIEVDGKLYLMYTEVWGNQEQSISVSEDGITFEQLNNGKPILTSEELPDDTIAGDFRDPKIWMQDDKYYSVIGSRQKNTFGQILLYESDNMLDWNYVGPVIQGSEETIEKLGRMHECPDLFNINGQDVLILSPQDIPNHRNGHGTAYIVGSLNYTTGELENWLYEDIEEIDDGFDFYAPQTMIDDKGRRIMVAWMQSWNRTPVMKQHGWAGAMTLPRILTLENGKLIQTPVPEINTYRKNYVEKKEYINGSNTFPEISGNQVELIIRFSPGAGKTGVTLFANKENKGTKVYYQDGYIYLDRNESSNGMLPEGEDKDFHNITKSKVELDEEEKIELRIFLDRFSVEVFINKGQKTITATTNPTIEDQGIIFYSDEPVHFDIKKWRLDVN